MPRNRGDDCAVRTSFLAAGILAAACADSDDTTPSDAASSTGGATNTTTATSTATGPAAYILAVEVVGPEGGAVLSSPPGVSCGDFCSAGFSPGTTVELDVELVPGAAFVGWDGDCTGTGACVVSMDADRYVMATLDPADPPQPLTVTVDGDGVGEIVSSPAGIECGDACDALFPGGSVVELVAAPGAASALTAWGGDCAGTPADAACSLTMDEPRSVTATFTQTGGVLEWYRRFEAPGWQLSSGAAVTPSGELYFAAWANGGVDYGSGPIFAGTGCTEVNSLIIDAAVVKLSPEGDPLWVRHVSGPCAELLYGLAIETSGDVLVSGLANGDLDTGCAVFPGAGYRGFLARYDGATGDCVWAREIPAGIGGVYLAVDPFAGDAIVVGKSPGPVDVGVGPMDGSAPEDTYVARIAPDSGDTVSAFLVPGQPSGELTGTMYAPRALADGGFVLLGAEEGAGFDLGGPPAEVAGDYDGVIARFNPAGQPVWARRLTGPGRDGFGTTTMVPGGGFAVIGSFEDEATFAGTSLQGQSDEVIVAELDADGDLVWVRSFGGGDLDQGYDVDVRDDGDLVISGLVSDGADLGQGAIPFDYGFTVARLAAQDGALVWQRVYDAGGPSGILSFGLDPTNALVGAGYCQGEIDFGDGVTGEDGSLDACVFRFSP